jgi:universal stress protein A
MTAKYKMVLIALDASDEADEVLQAATTLYPRGTENYRVVTVIPPMMGGISGMDGASFAASWPLKDMESEITAEITQAVKERVARYGISPDQVSVLYGRPAAEIRAEAEAVGADLIVIGSHSRHGLPRLMLGSTANGVLHGAPCDVLTVRISEGD